MSPSKYLSLKQLQMIRERGYKSLQQHNKDAIRYYYPIGVNRRIKELEIKKGTKPLTYSEKNDWLTYISKLREERKYGNN